MKSTMETNAILPRDVGDLQAPPKNVRVLGVDLGTTNCTVAEIVFEAGMTKLPAARCLEISQYTTAGEYVDTLVPSVVALQSDKTIVGEGAKRLRAKSSEIGLVPNTNLFCECKNDIGLRRTYHKAPSGYRSAAEISGHLLRFLRDAALLDSPDEIDRIVVTVPASFQSAQRQDTFKAAEVAGITLQGGDLLDEPVAAFIDYLARHADTLHVGPGETQRLLVFDFGGGTCDVAVFLLAGSAGDRPGISPLAVSRYHRLGGGDIDAAIVYEELVNQLAEQNGLDPVAFGYKNKKMCIEPAFIGLAEALKKGLCEDIARLMKFGRYESANKENVVKTQPGLYSCRLADGRELRLQSPRLNAARFEEILAPFLDKDLLYTEETEYRTTCSIFAPIQDALDRSGLAAKDVDLCLLVGGSSLIPQVRDAVRSFFPQGQLLSYSDATATQTAVARGASYHALSMALVGRGIMQPVSNDSLAVKTAAGLIDIVPGLASLPYPAGGEYARITELAVPESSLVQPLPLRLEIAAGMDQRIIFQGIWEIPSPVNKGEALRLEYRLDENQRLDLRMSLNDAPTRGSFSWTVENPLSHVINPGNTRQKIDEVEEDIRTGKIPPPQQVEKFVELAEDYATLKQYEKAIEYLSTVLRVKNAPDAYVLNKIAIYYGNLGDYEREEKFYREAARASSWTGPWFNLALLQQRRKKYREAMESVNKSLVSESEVPYLVLRAELHETLGHTKERDRDLKAALDDFGPPSGLSDWALGWLAKAARMSGDHEHEQAAREEQARRKKGEQQELAGGILPDMAGTLQRRN